MNANLKNFLEGLERRAKLGSEGVSGTELSEAMKLNEFIGKKVRVYSDITNRWRTETLTPIILAYYTEGNGDYIRITIEQ